MQSGEIKKAAKHFAVVAQDVAASQEMKDMNASLLASAEGDWATASSLLQSVVERDVENLVVNLSQRGAARPTSQLISMLGRKQPIRRLVESGETERRYQCPRDGAECIPIYCGDCRTLLIQSLYVSRKFFVSSKLTLERSS